MVKVKKFMVNPCEEATHIIWDETGEAVIIDCGVFYRNERENLLAFIKQEQLRPVRLLLTHAHHDHLYGNDLIYEHFGLLPEVHKDDEWMMTVYLHARLAQVFKDYPYPLPMPEHYLSDDEIIKFGNHHLTVIHTPGHSPGSVFFYCEEAKVAFSGDTLMANDIGRTNLTGGNEEQMRNTLDYITQLLPDDTVIYPGHTRKTTIGKEKVNNPFLQDNSLLW